MDNTSITAPNNNSNNEPVSIGNWIITFILLAIPLVNIILLIVWAVSSTVPQSKKNFAVAYLIFFIALAVLGVVVFLLGGLGLFLSQAQSMQTQ